MDINSVRSDYKAVQTKPQKASVKSGKGEKLGYSPKPEDSYKPDNGKEQGFISRAVDGIANFINKNIIGPGEKYANNLKTDFTTQAITAGTVIGGTTGAIVGHQAAAIEVANAKSQQMTWLEPDTVRKDLGNIPDDHYSWMWFDSNSFEYDNKGNLVDASHGVDPVYRNVPVYNADGSVKMHEVRGTVDSQRFGMFGGTMGGLVLGTIGGALAGIAVAMINKVVKGDKEML